MYESVYGHYVHKNNVFFLSPTCVIYVETPHTSRTHTYYKTNTHAHTHHHYLSSVLPHVVLSCSHDSSTVSAILALTVYIFCECQRSVVSADVHVPTTDWCRHRNTQLHKTCLLLAKCVWNIKIQYLLQWPLQVRGAPTNEVVVSGGHHACEGVPVTCMADDMQMWLANKRGFSQRRCSVRGRWLHLCNLHLTLTLWIKGW